LSVVNELDAVAQLFQELSSNTANTIAEMNMQRRLRVLSETGWTAVVIGTAATLITRQKKG